MTGSRLAASLLALALVGAASGSSPARWAAQGPAEGRADARELLRRGIDLAGRGRHEEAIAALRRYVRAVPDDPDGYLYLGSSLLQVALAHKRPPAEAGDVLEEGLRHDAARDDIRLKLTQVYGRRMPGTFRPDRTVELFEQLLSHHPSQGRLRLRYARWLVYGEIRLERTGAGLGASRVYQDSAWAMDKARALLREAIGLSARASNTAIEARTLLAEVQFRSGAWDAALATLKQLISGFPERHLNLASAWNTAGHCQYRKGDFKAAAESFRKAIDLKPTVAYRYDLKMAYDRLGGYPEDLPARYRFAQREEKIPKPEPLLAFEEIAARLNLNKRGGAGPCGWADYDGDGRFDLVVCGCDTFCSLYHAGAGRFDDVTKAAGLARLEPGFGAAWADYDNDGDPDLYIARNGWNGAAPNSLLQNRGNGTFVDVARQAGVADAGSSFHAAWFDYDRDGWLDLIVSNGVYLDGSGNRLYRNRGDGTFGDVTRRAGLAEPAGFGTIGVAVGDYDDDGWPDIFFHGRMRPNRLYRNNHDGTFTDRAAAAGVAGTGRQNGYVALMADFDSDADLDIFAGSLARWDRVLAGYRGDGGTKSAENLPRLYLNNGDGTFSDASLAAGFEYPLGIMAAGTADLDNDGYLDIYLGTGDPELRRLEPNIFYHNQAGRRFEDLTRYTGLGALGKGHGITFLDWDSDGDLDIFAELGGFYHGDHSESAFFLNKAGNRNHWLSVRLRQPARNRDAVGGRVTVRAGRWAQAQEVTAGRGFSSTDPPVLHFGLGGATRVDRIEVRWPDGSKQARENVAADQPIIIDRAIPPAR